MKKILVIGCPGSGKSTFSKRLHDITDIPLYHLDMMYWNVDKTIVDESVFRQRFLDAIRNDEWILDGNYGTTMELRLKECDTVFFLDYQLEVCLEGVELRRGKPRTDMPWIEAENEVDEEFIEFIKNYAVNNRPAVMELLDKYSYKEIHIFTNRNEAGEFLKNL